MHRTDSEVYPMYQIDFDWLGVCMYDLSNI